MTTVQNAQFDLSIYDALVSQGYEVTTVGKTALTLPTIRRTFNRERAFLEANGMTCRVDIVTGTQGDRPAYVVALVHDANCCR